MDGDIDVLIAQGDAFASSGGFRRALTAYQSALFRLGEDPHSIGSRIKLLNRMGDVLFLDRRYRAASAVFFEAISRELDHRRNHPDVEVTTLALGNPKVHLRIGQCLLELGHDMERVLDELLIAFVEGGEGVFGDEDPKYIEFIERYM